MLHWFAPPIVIGSRHLETGIVQVRYPQFHDADTWIRLRGNNREYLEPWEPYVNNWSHYHSRRIWRTTVRYLRRNGFLSDRQMFVIEYQGQFAGQISLTNIVHGALYSANCGYWIDHQLWNRGIATAALHMTIDHAFTTLGLHRLEATVQAHNYASLTVLEKNGFCYEGTLSQYMRIGGEWKDHLLLALVSTRAG